MSVKGRFYTRELFSNLSCIGRKALLWEAYHRKRHSGLLRADRLKGVEIQR